MKQERLISKEEYLKEIQDVLDKMNKKYNLSLKAEISLDYPEEFNIDLYNRGWYYQSFKTEKEFLRFLECINFVFNL